MPQLSDRITTLNKGGSDGWEVFYRARQMVAEGKDVIELTIGEHDIGTDAAILVAMHTAALNGATGYAMVPGIAPLREALAERVAARTGVPTTADNIIVTAGGQPGLLATHLATGDPGDAALYVDPYYATYPGTMRAASRPPVAVETSAEAAFLPDAAKIDRLAVESGAKSVLINTPNNPTGTVYPGDTLDAIARVTQDRDLWLISDEVYDTQIWEGDHRSPRALPGMADRTMVIGSMSKSHAMTGSRVGWICAPEAAVDALIDLATVTTYGVPGYIQQAALFALQEGDLLETGIATPFRRRRDLALAALKGQTAVGVIPSQGAMYLMLDVRSTGLSGRDFAEALLDAHHIAVMPGESFGTSAAGHIRIALTTEDDRLVSAIETLVAFAGTFAHAA
ncbi:pyridoxal phosphate-dependent aminotransferase [Allosediminivita pacifica]|uniref:Aminotransferase n=1 Tax=Allosediminivita pacifica TaxID=1267769 RepID=A0A2T6AVD0_9RHOB|nr:pyridoxal phosphate-dependent aminotransferase [Allosediminivita pacifica]PTX47768.1 arginine:pyruvate transaminase [Allosediminivita pacifica]GGB12960.1 aminotransferase [Allosediminivita pacifica]